MRVLMPFPAIFFLIIYLNICCAHSNKNLHQESGLGKPFASHMDIQKRANEQTNREEWMRQVTRTISLVQERVRQLDFVSQSTERLIQYSRNSDSLSFEEVEEELHEKLASSQFPWLRRLGIRLRDNIQSKSERQLQRIALSVIEERRRCDRFLSIAAEAKQYPSDISRRVAFHSELEFLHEQGL